MKRKPLNVANLVKAMDTLRVMCEQKGIPVTIPITSKMTATLPDCDAQSQQRFEATKRTEWPRK